MAKWNPYALNKPCDNCPFLCDEDKAISLAPGRRDGIIADLLSGETTGFSCHKTVYHPKTGGRWEVTEDGEGKYIPSNNEQQCAGAMAVLEKLGKQTDLMQIMGRLGVYPAEKYRAMAAQVIDYQPKEPQE